MHVDAGRLDKRVELLRRSDAADADGYAAAAEPEVVRSCWAQYSQTSGTEIVRAGGEFGEAKVRFLIRACPEALDRRLTVRYAGEEYEIDYVNTYGDERKYIELWCSRRTMEGRV